MSNKTLRHASLGSLVFFVISVPDFYTRTNKYFSDNSTCPTYKTRILHTIAFFVMYMLMMKYVEKDPSFDKQLAHRTLMATLMFFLLSSPEMYKVTNSFGLIDDIADESGCPTLTGVVVHSVVYFVSQLTLMYFE